MRNIVASLALIVTMLMPTRIFAAELTDKQFVEKAQNAVALLYSQDESGSMRMLCTATIFEKTKTGYLFASAAHCVGRDDVQHEKSAKSDNPFFVTFDEHKAKTFYPAAVKLVGYQSRGEDFAIFEVEAKADWPVIPLGDEQKEIAPAPYWNIASPLGLGKQVFEGNISSLDLDRPLKEGDINWQHTLVLQQTGVNGGSSGSTLIARDQRAIVGFLVGTIGGSTIVAISVSRFITVRKAVEQGKYKWFVPEVDLSSQLSK